VRERAANKNNANTQENRFAEEWPDEERKDGSRKTREKERESVAPVEGKERFHAVGSAMRIFWVLRGARFPVHRDEGACDGCGEPGAVDLKRETNAWT